MSDFEKIINNKVNHLVVESISVENNNLMDVLRLNFKLLEDRLYIYCKMANVSYIDTVIEILEIVGFSNVDRKVLTTYLNRLRKERGKV